MKIRVVAIIPCFDAAATVGQVVAATRERVEHVIVVDDGSSDGSGAAAAAAGAELLQHDVNQGKGAALQSGFSRALEAGFTHAMTLDADGQHLASEIPVVLQPLQRHPRSIVIGVRRRGENNEIAPVNRFGNVFADWWVGLAAGLRLGDSQSGFRVYPIKETLALGASAGRFAWESEVLILAGRRGLPVLQREIEAWYPPSAERRSHYEPWRDTIRIIATVVPWVFGFRR